MQDRRKQILEIVRKELVGPNPLTGYTQENGEEILFFDSPLKTYVSGVLFPQVLSVSDVAEVEQEVEVLDDDVSSCGLSEDDPLKKDTESRYQKKEKFSVEDEYDREASKINTYKQSAMSFTSCIAKEMSCITIFVSAGKYSEKQALIPRGIKDDNEEYHVSLCEPQKKTYWRKQLKTKLILYVQDLPTQSQRYKSFIFSDETGLEIEFLEFAITYRLDNENGNIYTFTLINKATACNEHNIALENCFFQCEFSVESDKNFVALPENFYEENEDADYQEKGLLYRNVKTYAIGHGCAALWDDKVDVVNKINSSALPLYEVKQITVGTSTAKLEMKKYATDAEFAISDLRVLCCEYENWINDESKKANVVESVHAEQAQKQIEHCRECLKRMQNGLLLLTKDKKIQKAFMLMNKAMLMQQLHYNLPLTEWDEDGSRDHNLVLKSPIIMPNYDNEETWYEKETHIYGKWRSFQIAFILMNLISLNDAKSPEHKLVDLIWFPTGGGKTEAYLGLTAFTIFLRRLNNKDDAGTAIIMRYTLRLLTAQQYERASSLICACEKIRYENKSELGEERITVGMWVGPMTANKNIDAIKKHREICNSKGGNTSVVLKCPWCGASMQTVKISANIYKTPGYKTTKINKQEKLILQCDNENCDFSNEEHPLPLLLFDDDIYANPPTLLFGTVDKFAMLPYYPQAKALFGGGKFSPPELIIQDELHLITGPLGSMVGLYETLIAKLCEKDGIGPKIVASTATISHAKQQCHALYNCGEENVFQFPAQGTDYKNNFFSIEDAKASGRIFCGLYGSAAPSSATASIHLFATLLFAAKALDVENEIERNPYWTNLCYFGSMRELGQAATWYIADIKEQLEVVYKSKLMNFAKDSKEHRRYIYESGLAELTSRMSSDEIPKILKDLEANYPHEKDKKTPLDMCLATNMVSVGVDIQRLGLMTLTGQPKSTAEYIQTTSRVGRDGHNPGLIFVIYNTSKPRDKSHYEQFQSYHSKLYYHVEPTSVTPFSAPARARAIHAILVGFERLFFDHKESNIPPSKSEIDSIIDIIKSRVESIDSSEAANIVKQIEKLGKEWAAWSPTEWGRYGYKEDLSPLMFPAGTAKNPKWENRGWETPASMRSVDRECAIDCSEIYVTSEDQDV